MGLKEVDIRSNFSLPRDSDVIINKRFFGVKTHDGSFDYSPEGQKFLGAEAKVILAKEKQSK